MISPDGAAWNFIYEPRAQRPHQLSSEFYLAAAPAWNFIRDLYAKTELAEFRIYFDALRLKFHSQMSLSSLEFGIYLAPRPDFIHGAALKTEP